MWSGSRPAAHVMGKMKGNTGGGFLPHVERTYLTVSPSACRTSLHPKILWDAALGCTPGAGVHHRWHYVPHRGRRSASQWGWALLCLLSGGVHHQGLRPFNPHYVCEEGQSDFAWGSDEGPPRGSVLPAVRPLLDHGELPGLGHWAAEERPGVRERVPSQAVDPRTLHQLLWPLQDLKHCEV